MLGGFLPFLKRIGHIASSTTIDAGFIRHLLLYAKDSSAHDCFLCVFTCRENALSNQTHRAFIVYSTNNANRGKRVTTFVSFDGGTYSVEMIEDYTYNGVVYASIPLVSQNRYDGSYINVYGYSPLDTVMV